MVILIFLNEKNIYITIFFSFFCILNKFIFDLSINS